MGKRREVATKVGQTGPPPLEPDKEYVNPGREDQMEISGYQRSRVRTVLAWLGYLFTAGLLRLVFHWRPDWMLKVTHTSCRLGNAGAVMLKDQYKQIFVEKVKTITKDGTSVKIVPRRDGRESHLLMPGLKSSRQGSSGDLVMEPLYHDDSLVRYFSNKKLKYIWNAEKQSYSKLRGIEEGVSCAYFHNCHGLSEVEKIRRRVLYGANHIRVRVTPIIQILFLQVLNPFYIFQVFSCILWYVDEYYYYASCIVLISAISICTYVYQTRQMQRRLRETIQASGTVFVCRGEGDFVEVPSSELVPGDLIEIPRYGCIMSCDAVLINGNCIVNESMLTGESVPVTKTALPNPMISKEQRDVHFSIRENSRNVLFCGTNVIQTRYYGNQKVKAVVIRTGFMTSKGDLVRSILFPKPVDFKFTRDTYKFVGVLGFMSFCGFVYTAVIMAIRGDTFGKIMLRCLDLVTIAVPPALPAALTVGSVFAQGRLKKRDIFCISPSSIPVTGSINVVCFDKTGTLTEDGLDMWGVVPASDQRFTEVVHAPSLLPRGPFLITMATCHSLTKIKGQISGDPLDLKMFEVTDWELDEPGEEDTSKFDTFAPTVVRPRHPDVVRDSSLEINEPGDTPYEVGIVRQFTFSSSLQRMSVIARTLGERNFCLYAKGAPETIASLCKAETIPVDFHDKLLEYTQHGYRVLALAWKPLHAKVNYVKTQRITREQVEYDLIFLGLLVMENRLKPETTPVIRQLREANVRTVMVTGDNMLTAVSVARDCDMIDPSHHVILVNSVLPPPGKTRPTLEWMYAEDTKRKVEEVHCDPWKSTAIDIDLTDQHFHFAVSGKTWTVIKEHYPELLPKIVVRGTVFARMSPDQKQQLVETLQQLGYYVSMCGDGANDCGALKTAHAGISLSEAEASVASPFTSKHQNIECVPTVIREGRAALTTTFGIFKYMACYSLTQFVSVLILYWIGSNLTDFQFLYIDLVVLTSLSITFSRTGAFSKLTKDKVPISLISPQPILSVILQMGIQTTAQALAYLLVYVQPWFVPYVINPVDEYASYENSAIFSVSAFQYITLAVVFSKGAPLRKTVFSNYAFLINLIILTLCTVWIVIYPLPFMVDLLELKLMPSVLFRTLMVGFAVINFFLSMILESFILDGYIRRRVADATECCAKTSRFHYMEIEDEIANTPEWPPISREKSDLAQLLRDESNLEAIVQRNNSRKESENSDSSATITSIDVIPGSDSYKGTKQLTTDDRPKSLHDIHRREHGHTPRRRHLSESLRYTRPSDFPHTDKEDLPISQKKGFHDLDLIEGGKQVLPPAGDHVSYDVSKENPSDYFTVEVEEKELLEENSNL